MKCKHENGWFLPEGETIVINPSTTNDEYNLEFECNSIDCKERRKFKFEITDFREARK
jgi:hypothetical protein